MIKTQTVTRQNTPGHTLVWVTGSCSCKSNGTCGFSVIAFLQVKCILNVAPHLIFKCHAQHFVEAGRRGVTPSPCSGGRDTAASFPVICADGPGHTGGTGEGAGSSAQSFRCRLGRGQPGPGLERFRVSLPECLSVFRQVRCTWAPRTTCTVPRGAVTVSCLKGPVVAALITSGLGSPRLP